MAMVRFCTTLLCPIILLQYSSLEGECQSSRREEAGVEEFSMKPWRMALAKLDLGTESTL